MKIAICYFGLTRSTKKVYKTHHAKIFSVLKKSNINFKVYMHTWKTVDNKQFVNGKMVDNPIDYDEYKLLMPDYYSIESQDEFIDNVDMDKYFYKDVWDKIGHSRKGEWLPQLIKNHICALESQKRVLNMVEGSDYEPDFVMIIRPDCLIKKHLPIQSVTEFLIQNRNGICIPNFAHHEGYNDRFAIMNYCNSQYYCKRIDEITEFRKTNGRIVSEKFTKFICNKYYEVSLINFKFDLIRP